MTRGAFLSALLVAVLLGASVPLLAAVALMPSQGVLGGPVVLTQGTGPFALTDALVADLLARPFVEAVSPEAVTPSYARGQALILRGIDPVAYGAVEGAALPTAEATFAYVGTSLAGRLGVSAGDALVLGGFLRPKFVEVVVTAVVDLSGPGRDELLLPHAVLRELSGLPPDGYHALRLVTADLPALVAHLEALGASVHVAVDGRVVASVASDPPADTPLASFLLRLGGPLPRDLVTRAVVQATNAVRVAALGIGLAVALLAFLAVRASLGRVLTERSDRIATLQALGGSPRAIRRVFLRDFLPGATAASTGGILLGTALAAVVGFGDLVLALGYTVRPALDPVRLLGLAAYALLAALLAGIVELRPWLARRPAESSPDGRGGPNLGEVLLP